MTDDTRLPDVITLATTMPTHWGLVFRHYEATDRPPLAQAVAKLCKARGIFFILAGDWRLACAVNADGLHMPEGLLRNQAIAPILNAYRSRILTTSAHGTAGLRLAKIFDADAVFLSPVQKTKSHADAKPLGTLPFAAMVKNYGMATYALGGVSLRDRARLMALGAAGIAGISLAGEKV